MMVLLVDVERPRRRDLGMWTKEATISAGVGIVKWANRAHASSAAKRRANMEQKGYRKDRVMAEANMVGHGRSLSGTAWAAVVRTDGCFSRDVVVVSGGSDE